MSKDLAIINEKQQQAREEIIEFLKLSGWNNNATKEQVELFIKYAVTAELNPLKREIYFVPFNGKYQPITGYQVYIARAFKSGKLDYFQPRFEKTENGDMKCVVEIKRKDSTKPMFFATYLSEVKRETPIWKAQLKYMFEKVAIVQALRKAIPDSDEIASLPYAEEEIGIELKENEPVLQKEELNINEEEEIKEIEFELGDK